MAMKVDYGVVTKAIMVVKFENVILCCWGLVLTLPHFTNHSKTKDEWDN